MTRSDMPRRVYLRHSRFFYVTMAGKWLPLTKEKDGLAAMHRALAGLIEAEVSHDTMPAVIGRWLAESEPEWSEKHTVNQRRYAKVLAAGMRDHLPADVTTKACNEFLRQFAGKARTFNAYRTALRGSLALAAREGLREGFDPLDNIPKKKTPGRHRMVTDGEANRIRLQALSQPRNGKALAQMIELALLTGRRISDLIRLRWQDVTDDGIYFEEGKGEGRSKILVEWSPTLRLAIEVCKRGDVERIDHVLQKETGGPYRYSGIRSAWVRACDRCGVLDLNIHDLRGRAGVDAMGDDEDVRKAQRLLGHSGEAMTRHYVEGKYAKKVKPTR